MEGIFENIFYIHYHFFVFAHIASTQKPQSIQIAGDELHTAFYLSCLGNHRHCFFIKRKKEEEEEKTEPLGLCQNGTAPEPITGNGARRMEVGPVQIFQFLVVVVVAVLTELMIWDIKRGGVASNMMDEPASDISSYPFLYKITKLSNVSFHGDARKKSECSESHHHHHHHWTWVVAFFFFIIIKNEASIDS